MFMREAFCEVSVFARNCVDQVGVIPSEFGRMGRGDGEIKVEVRQTLPLTKESLAVPDKVRIVCSMLQEYDRGRACSI